MNSHNTTREILTGGKTFVIEPNIPLIPRKNSKAINWEQVLGSMRIGDSFEYPDGKEVPSNIRVVSRKLNIEITVRRQSDKVCRVWRIA